MPVLSKAEGPVLSKAESQTTAGQRPTRFGTRPPRRQSTPAARARCAVGPGRPMVSANIGNIRPANPQSFSAHRKQKL
jgi:hypothetical protein